MLRALQSSFSIMKDIRKIPDKLTSYLEPVGFDVIADFIEKHFY